MAAGDPGSPARYYSSTAVETSLSGSIPAQSQGQANTAFIVASVSGFPASYPYSLIVDPDTSKEEVVTVTAGSGTTLTVTRGSDNTQAVAHSAGAVVRHGVSGREFREAENHIAARGFDIDQTILDAANQTHVHGIATGDGVIVGTLKAQTLTQKTLTTPIINGATITGAVTASAATFTSPTISGSPVITGLSSAGMVDSSAAPKNYVDSILGSATSAAISAASAAVSATSAATSATSALNSATAAATSAASALVSQSAASTSATSAAASATAAATSAASAAASTSAAATSAASALVSANSAATSAASALVSQSAAATSATSASLSAAAAATSAVSASASATAASTSETNAAASALAASTSATSASASATAAATSATSASSSATAAATSATSANSSATAAATSASSASTSASSALTSANSAATSYDEFDDRYLGAKSTPPTLDNDGNALLTGALYWNTVSNKMFVWSGSAWTEISSTADLISYKYTATAGQTSVSGADDNSLTLAYTVGKEQVYINGVLQVRGSDYVATTGTSITSIPAMLAGDIVTVLAFTTFVVPDTYTQAQANATFPLNSIDKSAGKNKIINGDFGVWQRGTSFTNLSGFGADRFSVATAGGSGHVFSQQTFTPGTAPVAGYEGTYFARMATAAGATYYDINQKIEDVRTFAGQTVTFSFWAKASSSVTMIALLRQQFGTGGSANVDKGSSGITFTTSWARYTFTITLDSIAGKTIGTGSALQAYLYYSSGTVASNNIDTWGWQVEAGSVATAFQTATGTVQGELAACQRYYTTSIPTGFTITDFSGMNPGSSSAIAWCSPGSSNDAFTTIQYPVPMRAAPTFNIYSAGNRTSGSIRDAVTGSDITVSNYSVQAGNNKGFNYLAGMSATTGRPYSFQWTASAEL